jgi:hypothetical protein
MKNNLIYDPEYYNINEINEMIETYKKRFEEDCIKNNYTSFYYKFSQTIKECRLNELEKLKENIKKNPKYMIKP